MALNICQALMEGMTFAVVILAGRAGLGMPRHSSRVKPSFINLNFITWLSSSTRPYPYTLNPKPYTLRPTIYSGRVLADDGAVQPAGHDPLRVPRAGGGG